jgi:hypothetical protein
MLTYVTAALVALAAALIARFLLAPDAPSARLLPLSDRAARFLHRWLVALATVGSVAWLTAALLILSGMQLEAHLVLALAIGALIAVLLSAMILAGGRWSPRRWSAMTRQRLGRYGCAWRARGLSSRSRI